MKTLNFGAIMEREGWFEDYDLSCPHCNGSGEQRTTTYKMVCKCGNKFETEVVTANESEAAQTKFEEGSLNECPKCGDRAEYDSDFTVEACEQCTNGQFEVMYNTAYHVDLSSSRDTSALRLVAWDIGFCLIEHDGDHYLLMGGYGQDMTWIIHYTRWQVQGFLHIEDIEDCLASGGHVHLGSEKVGEMCKYFKEHIPTPEEYAAGYKSQMQQIRKLAGRSGGKRKSA